MAKDKPEAKPVVVDNLTLFVVGDSQYVLAKDQACAEGLAKIALKGSGKVGLCKSHPGKGTRCVVQKPPVKFSDDPKAPKPAAKDVAEAKRRGELNYEVTSL